MLRQERENLLATLDKGGAVVKVQLLQIAKAMERDKRYSMSSLRPTLLPLPFHQYLERSF